MQGLSQAESADRLKRFGPNALPEAPSEPLLRRFLRQFQSPLIYILLFALVVDLFVWVREGATGVPVETFVIGLILFLNAALGTWQEQKAEAALAHLKALAAPQVWTLRDGEWRQVPAADLVPGDLVRLEAGDRVPADGTIEDSSLSIDESIVTGESIPVDKSKGDETLSGTLVVRGRSYVTITRTGTQSTLGQLAGLLGQVENEGTPLERRLEKFGKQIAIGVLILAALLVVEGVVTEGFDRIGHAFLFAVALAVAAVPEGLPAVLTFALALGVERMASRQAVVRKLAAVEALGSVTVIATDKTGTITSNKLEVRDCDTADKPALLRAMVHANDAETGAGDPLDVALLEYAAANGVDPALLRREEPRLSSRPFDSDVKFTRGTVRQDERAVSYLKGAFEVLIARSRLSPEDRAQWEQRAETRAGEGYRVLGFAMGEGEAEEQVHFLGLALLWDPPRPEVPAAIAQARSAGIRVLMITGDHPATALSIARQVGIDAPRVVTGADLDRADAATLAATVKEVNVYARVRPEQKLLLVEKLHEAGEIVAMTGDGVNDAPALKRSDVGVAMGQRGSDVSREVADLVLLDDNFRTIAAAIEEGRSIYENVQKFLRFLFSTNLSEVIVVGVGVMLAAALNLREADGSYLLPLTAAQILWINLVTDGLPALSLALDRNPEAMRQAPRPPSAPLLDRPSLRFVITSGLIKGCIALGILGLSQFAFLQAHTARTAAFHFMAIGQLFFAYPARHTDLVPLPNPVLHAAVACGVLLQIGIGALPWTQGVLGLVPLTLAQWAGVLGAALSAWGIAELVNRILWRPEKR
ncbi:MAG: HAD-IC family P-type ATPase [Bryobacterales bacterium]|nr:HAD-IC family P-type ATPase [Bryobacterales bacterium]